MLTTGLPGHSSGKQFLLDVGGNTDLVKISRYKDDKKRTLLKEVPPSCDRGMAGEERACGEEGHVQVGINNPGYGALDLA